jgi:hypothetical protein
MITMYEKCNDVLVGSPSLFVCSATRLKSIRVERDVNQEPLAFCMWHCACKKYKSRVERRSGASCFLYAALQV